MTQKKKKPPNTVNFEPKMVKFDQRWAYIEPHSNTKISNLWLNQAQNHFKLYI